MLEGHCLGFMVIGLSCNESPLQENEPQVHTYARYAPGCTGSRRGRLSKVQRRFHRAWGFEFVVVGFVFRNLWGLW